MQEKSLELNKQLAKHMRDVFFGGNWNSVNLKQTTCDIDWNDAIKKTDQFNTIATLVFHIGYYIKAVLKVLQG